ncbi:MAG: hypothetical protein GF334_04325 [Candidatus Altiarchaeales archaeon]|nr:hypothetical protein [Candidatus Altiarchaeales archaeon]
MIKNRYTHQDILDIIDLPDSPTPRLRIIRIFLIQDVKFGMGLYGTYFIEDT